MNTKKIDFVPFITWGIAIAVIIIGWYYVSGGFEKQVSNNIDNIYQKVASDAVIQYDIAKRSGTTMDACIRAGIVSAAYLQAKDEANYSQWKQQESKDCAKAGISR